VLQVPEQMSMLQPGEDHAAADVHATSWGGPHPGTLGYYFLKQLLPMVRQEV